jgi:osmotically inducible protein OsmC
MAFAFACEKSGINPISIDTMASVRLAKQGDGFAIDQIILTMQATIPDLDNAKFQELALVAKRDCPLSKALAGVPDIVLKARLGQDTPGE